MNNAFLYVIIVSILIKVTLETLQEDITIQIHNKNDTKKTLSRRKRYLVFPEGSSFQLVYCLTLPSLGVGEIFTIGATAALAWELPHDPYVPFRKPAEVLHRIDKGGEFSSGGWTVQNDKFPEPVTALKTYFNPFMVNKPSDIGYSTINSISKQPVYTTINKDVPNSNKRRTYNKYDSYKRYNDFIHENNNPITTYVDPVHHQIYRRTRRDLYVKLENFFTALSKDGKACLLKAICEVSGSPTSKGTFMEEIIKVIFRAKPHDDYQDEDHYDKAVNKNHNCTEMYPTCSHSVWSNMF